MEPQYLSSDTYHVDRHLSSIIQLTDDITYSKVISTDQLLAISLNQ